jgi:hypothetical protein
MGTSAQKESAVGAHLRNDGEWLLFASLKSAQPFGPKDLRQCLGALHARPTALRGQPLGYEFDKARCWKNPLSKVHDLPMLGPDAILYQQSRPCLTWHALQLDHWTPDRVVSQVLLCTGKHHRKGQLTALWPARSTMQGKKQAAS